MKIIAVLNQKGGVGKTATAAAITGALLVKGYKVLTVDLDAQANLTYTMGATDETPTAAEILTRQAAAKEAIKATDQGADIIPAGKSLVMANNDLTMTGREYRLKEALKPVKDNYDFIIIDTPPALSVLTINALTAADTVIIPAQADVYSLQGITGLSETLDTVKEYTNPNLQIGGILLTRYSNRAALSRDMADLLEETAKALHTHVFKSRIRECISIKEAATTQQNLFTYAPRSNAVKDYGAFMDELLASIGNESKEG